MISFTHFSCSNHFDEKMHMLSAQGKRVATVMSVDPKREFSLKLSNNEFIPDDTDVKRIKTLHKADGKYCLIPHSGVFRRIYNFKLVKLNPPKDYHIFTESERVRNILKKNTKIARKKAQKSGFAPMDMLHRYGKKGKDDRYEGSSSESDSKEELGVTRHVTSCKRIHGHDSDASSEQADYEDNDDSDNDDSDNDDMFSLLPSKSKMAIINARSALSLRNDADVESSSDSGSDAPVSSGKPVSCTTVQISQKAKALLSLCDMDVNSDDSSDSSVKLQWKDQILGPQKISGKENVTPSPDLSGDSDDELPQAMFHAVPKPKEPKTQKIDRRIPQKSKKRRYKEQKSKAVESSDSEDSMNFHSDNSVDKTSSYKSLPDKRCAVPEDLLSSDSDSDSDSGIASRIAPAKMNNNSGDDKNDNSDDDKLDDRCRVGHKHMSTSEVKKPIYVKKGKSDHFHDSRSFRKSSSVKQDTARDPMKRPLTFSIRKYN